MFKKQFGNTKTRTLEYKLEVHKQKLRASSDKLKYQKTLHKRKVINRQFANNPRQVFYYRSQGSTIKAEVIPPKEDVEKFWNDKWGKKGNFNNNAEWLKILETTYCPNVTVKEYTIKNSNVKKAIQKLQLKNHQAQI